jgi:hypothetical protein
VELVMVGARAAARAGALVLARESGVAEGLEMGSALQQGQGALVVGPPRDSALGRELSLEVTGPPPAPGWARVAMPRPFHAPREVLALGQVVAGQARGLVLSEPRELAAAASAPWGTATNWR